MRKNTLIPLIFTSFALLACAKENNNNFYYPPYGGGGNIPGISGIGNLPGLPGFGSFGGGGAGHPAEPITGSSSIPAFTNTSSSSNIPEIENNTGAYKRLDNFVSRANMTHRLQGHIAYEASEFNEVVELNQFVDLIIIEDTVTQGDLTQTTQFIFEYHDYNETVERSIYIDEELYSNYSDSIYETDEFLLDAFRTSLLDGYGFFKLEEFSLFRYHDFFETESYLYKSRINYSELDAYSPNREYCSLKDVYLILSNDNYYIESYYSILDEQGDFFCAVNSYFLTF